MGSVLLFLQSLPLQWTKTMEIRIQMVSRVVMGLFSSSTPFLTARDAMEEA